MDKVVGFVKANKLYFAAALAGAVAAAGVLGVEVPEFLKGLVPTLLAL
jgi:hypothetical protein